jgi:TonB family protein
MQQIRRVLMPLGLLATLSCAGLVRASSQSDSSRPAQKLYLFNIPSQRLSQALLGYGSVVGNQIIYDSRLARHLRSNPVVGLFTADAALRKLLEGTDLIVLPTGSQDVYLARRGDRGAAARAAGVDGSSGVLVLDTLYVDVPQRPERPAEFTAYGELVRTEIRRALQRDPATIYEVYDATIELWIDEHGRVQRPTLVKSTGSSRLDRAIRAALADVVVVKPPPRGMPQPVHAAITGR